LETEQLELIYFNKYEKRVEEQHGIFEYIEFFTIVYGFIQPWGIKPRVSFLKQAIAA
jgi:hypothetical protein